MKLLFVGAVNRLRQPVRDDSGFSLIEAIVAIFVAAVAFTALATASMSAVRGSLTARQNQQAADFMARELEAARLLDFGSLAMVSADLAGDADISTCAGKKCIDPGTGTKEILYTGATGTGGAITNHVKTVSATDANNTDYTVKTYVTTPDDSYGAEYRRVTVLIRWNSYGNARERRISTIIAFSQNGLPLPVFKLTPQGPTTVSVNPGADVVFGFRLTNQGAPDRFNLSEDDANSWTWTYDDGDGSFDAAADTTPVVDTNGDGIIDTDRLNPNGFKVFWVHRTVPSGSTASSTTTVWSGTSIAQPLADGAVQTSQTTTNVVTGVITPTPTPTSTTPTPSPTPASDCNTPPANPTATASAGYSLVSYTLHNAATPADTTAQSLLSMNKTAATATTLYQYSTDVAASQPGRVLTTGGTFSTGSASQVADWRYPVGKKAYSGTATMTLWAGALSGGSAADLDLTAYVYKYVKSGSTYTPTLFATIPLQVSPLACTGFQKLVGSSSASFAVPQLGQNDQIGVKVVNSGTTDVRIAYDVQSLYPSTLVLPEK